MEVAQTYLKLLSLFSKNRKKYVNYFLYKILELKKKNHHFWPI